MTALTTARALKERILRDTAYPMDANIKVLAGALVALSAAGDARPAGNATASRCVGVATETVDNTGGIAGEEMITTRRSCYPFATTDITKADVGKVAYAVDDQTVTKTAPATNPAKAGEIVEVEAIGSTVQVWVNLMV
jgi:hypothetical protein